jgi:hypothetical protein
MAIGIMEDSILKRGQGFTFSRNGEVKRTAWPGARSVAWRRCAASGQSVQSIKVSPPAAALEDAEMQDAREAVCVPCRSDHQGDRKGRCSAQGGPRLCCLVVSRAEWHGLQADVFGR